MRTYVDLLGVGPSSTNTWNQPGGQTCAFGGAVIVHVLPAHDTAGNKMRWPMLLPWVLASAPSNDTRRFAVLPAVMVMGTEAPYVQSLLAMV